MEIVDAFDFILLPIYLGIFYILANRNLRKNSKNPLYKLYYRKGLNYKFIGSVGFAFIYVFYYKGGDTISFYHAVHPLFTLFYTDPIAFLTFILSYHDPYPWQCLPYAWHHSIAYLIRGSATLTTIRIGALVNVLCFNSYFALCLAFAYISYQFQWRMFLLLASIYPSQHKRLSVAFLMIPSVIFWGSGLSKDCIMMGCIMLFFYCFYNVVIYNRRYFRYFVMLFFAGFLMSLIRGFILFTLFPCLMLMAGTYYRNAIRSSAIRFLIGPVVVVGALGASYLFVHGLGSEVQTYSVESLQQKAEGFHSWHTSLAEKGGSGYSIEGDVKYTAGGVLKQAPKAIAIALFGPFVWQIRSPIMALSGIESLLFLYFTLRMLFNKRIYALGGVLVQDHIINFCVPFSIILAVAIGLTSFNYGALVRYKIPILPFFATALILINYRLNNPDAK